MATEQNISKVATPGFNPSIQETMFICVPHHNPRLEIKPRAVSILVKCSAIKPYPSLVFCFLKQVLLPSVGLLTHPLPTWPLVLRTKGAEAGGRDSKCCEKERKLGLKKKIP